VIGASVLERDAMIDVGRLAVDHAAAAPARVRVANQDPDATGSPVRGPVVFDLFRRRGFQSGRAVAFEAGWHYAAVVKVNSAPLPVTPDQIHDANCLHDL